MPKTPHDNLAFAIFIGGFLFGSLLLQMAKKRFSEAQQATLRERWKLDPILLGSALGIFGAYYFAPLHPYLAILGAVVFGSVCCVKLVRLHSGQGYSVTTRGFLVASLFAQLAGCLGAVFVRTVA